MQNESTNKNQIPNGSDQNRGIIRPEQVNSDELSKFGSFKRPIGNITPDKDIDILQLCERIKNPMYYGANTAVANALYREFLKTGNKTPYSTYKASHFDYCTLSGIFNNRSMTGLIMHSGYIRIDFDNLTDPLKLKNDLLNDDRIETDLLFITPSGHGIAWIVSIEPDINTHADFYNKIGRYIINRYKIPVECFDLSAKDVSRATFICHDAECFINPKYLNQ